jgi:hypothetical protein
MGGSIAGLSFSDVWSKRVSCNTATAFSHKIAGLQCIDSAPSSERSKCAGSAPVAQQAAAYKTGDFYLVILITYPRVQHVRLIP